MERHFAFEGGVNFRDFGGYETTDRRRVKWRKLFRSGQLTGLTDTDRDRIDALDIAAVCDFRLESERAEHPSRLSPTLASRVLPLGMASERPGAERFIPDFIKDPGFAPEIAKVVDRNYRILAIDHADRYAEMFRALLTAEGRGILIHCHAGKDRTGIGAALILLALGVPEERIVEDYMLTPACPFASGIVNRMIDHGLAAHPSDQSREALFAAVLRVFYLAPHRIENVLQAMKDEAGSLDDFLLSRTGLSRRDRETLQARYLE